MAMAAQCRRHDTSTSGIRRELELPTEWLRAARFNQLSALGAGLLTLSRLAGDTSSAASSPIAGCHKLLFRLLRLRLPFRLRLVRWPSLVSQRLGCPHELQSVFGQRGDMRFEICQQVGPEPSSHNRKPPPARATHLAHSTPRRTGQKPATSAT